MEYVNVRESSERMAEFLGLSAGGRRVPLIVDDAGKVTIGFGGT